VRDDTKISNTIELQDGLNTEGRQEMLAIMQYSGVALMNDPLAGAGAA
jgi:hypothetical protein